MSRALARAPRGGAFIRQPYYHDPGHLHLGIWETPGDAELPGPVTVATAGSCAIYGCDNGDEQPVEQAAMSLRLKPTRLYGRTLVARSETVAIPGLLDASRTRQVPVTACFERHERPLASDLGTLCSVLMRGLVWKTQAGKPRTVVTLGYRVPPCNPLAQAYPLAEKLDALERFARDFARTRRAPLLLAEYVGDTVLEPMGERGRVYARVVYTRKGTKKLRRKTVSKRYVMCG
jgi:hypothetical protein